MPIRGIHPTLFSSLRRQVVAHADGESSRIDPDELLAEANWVRRLARGLVRDAGSADDLAQDTWLAALGNPRGSGTPLRPWLARVAGNLTRDKRRADATREHREKAWARSERVPSASELAERIEAHRLLIEALAALPEPYKSTVTLRYLHGQSAATIARRQGIPAGTVRWRLKHGLDELRTNLDRRFHGDRRTWCLAFLPLLRRPSLFELASSSASATLQGIMVMNVMMRIGIVTTVVVAAGFGVWMSADHPRATSEFEARAAPPESAALATPPRVDEVLGDRTSVIVGDRASVPLAPEKSGFAAVEETGTARLVARFVNVAAQPIVGVRLSATSAGHEERAESGGDGRATVAFEIKTATFEVADVEASIVGYATHFSNVSLHRGKTTWLGDVVLRPGAAIEGIVHGADGRALEQVDVRATKPDLFGDPADARRTGPTVRDCPRARTSADGSFRIDGVAAGTPVRVWAGGTRMRWAFSAPVELAPQEVKSGLELTLEPLAKEDVIEGIVLTPEGTPAPNADVGYSYSARNQSGSSSTHTGADGRFLIRLVRIAPYNLYVTDPSNRWPGLTALQVAPGVPDLELKFSVGRSIDLVVRERDGTPIERYSTQLLTVDKRRSYGSTKEEDHPGGKLALALPRERCQLSVVARGHAPSDLEPIDPASLGGSIEVRLDRRPGLRGRVTADGRPVAGAKLELHAVAEANTTIEHEGFPSRLNPGVQDVTTSDSDGAFQLNADEKKTFAILCEANGFALAELSPLDVDPIVGIDRLDIALGAGGSIEGRVVLPPGKDPAGVIVAIDRYDARPSTQRVGPDGRFAFDRLTPGRWRVKRVAAEVDRGHAGSYAISGGSSRPEYPWDCVVVDGEVTRHDLDLSQDLPCVLAGFVTANGKPATGWTATVWPSTNISTRELPGGAVDAEGRLRLELREPGNYYVNLRAPTESGGQGTFRTPAMALHRGDNLWPLDLRLGRIEGHAAAIGENSQLTYAWRDPAGLTFYCIIQPDADGKFALPLVPAGSGQLARAVQSEEKAQRSERAKMIDVRAGETVIVEAP